jgi:hypothetical protein
MRELSHACRWPSSWRRPGAASARPAPLLHYQGKTKEGAKISFVLKNGWVDQLITSLPSTCVSAQGGTPHVRKFRLGYTSKVDYGYPKTHYHVTTHHRGTRISGTLSMNWSELSDDGFGGYIILECLGTAWFNLVPR